MGTVSRHHRQHRLSWPHIYKVLSGAVHKVEAFNPSVLLAVSSAPRGGGAIPALLLKASLHNNGFGDVALHTLNPTSTGAAVASDLSAWKPADLNGIRVLLVEKADNSRRTLSKAVAEVEKVFAAAMASASGDPSWRAPCLGVFVLQNKRRTKATELPVALLNSSYFAAEEVEDGIYQYPWDCEDQYMISWRGACSGACAMEQPPMAVTTSDASPVSENGQVEAVVLEQVPAYTLDAACDKVNNPTWLLSLGPAFIAAWHEACAGFDTDQQVAAMQQLVQPACVTWAEQLGNDYIAAWRRACGMDVGCMACDAQRYGGLTTAETLTVIDAAGLPAGATTLRNHVMQQYLSAYRAACASVGAE